MLQAETLTDTEYSRVKACTWWWHGLENISTLKVFCDGNPPVSRYNRPLMQSFDGAFLLAKQVVEQIGKLSFFLEAISVTVMKGEISWRSSLE